MIQIPTDEAIAYDMLSIMLIKTFKRNNPQDTANYMQLEWALINQLGEELHKKICASEPYVKLYSANLRLFAHIDDMKRREAKAEDALFVDSRNFERYACKQVLQQTFFPEKPLTEQKVGYEGFVPVAAP